MTDEPAGPDSVGPLQTVDGWSDGPILVDLMLPLIGWASWLCFLLAGLAFMVWAFSTALGHRRGSDEGMSLPSGAIALALMGTLGNSLPSLLGVERTADPAPEPPPVADEAEFTPLLDVDALLTGIGKGLLWTVAVIGAILVLGLIVVAAVDRVQKRRAAAAKQAAELAAELERLTNLTAYEIVMEGLSPDVRAAIEQAVTAKDEAPAPRRRKMLRSERRER